MSNIKIFRESSSQTAGPYVHIGLTPNFIGIKGTFPQDLGFHEGYPDLQGEKIVIKGQIFDVTGAPIRDAMIETWQADGNGKFHPEPTGKGFRRFPVDLKTGNFELLTVKPGKVTQADGSVRAPHILMMVMARGINIILSTYIYFADETEANASDPVLGKIEHKHRINTLLAENTAAGQYKFDLRLRGENETVFFDF